MRSKTWLISAAIFIFPAVAHAADRFEIQVYDASADRKGQGGVELHLNSFAKGDRWAVAPEVPLHHQTHATLEPSYGLTDWWELGCYLQSALTEDGSFHYGGVKLRTKFVTTKGFSETIRLGLNFELSNVPEIFEANVWGGEIRPIFAFENRRFLFAINPNLEFAFAHVDAKDAVEIAPGALGLVKIAGVVGVGFEYYGYLGPVTDLRLSTRDEHLLFEAVHIFAEKEIELSFGVGESISDSENKLIFKTIVGYAFDVTGQSHGQTARLVR